MTDRKIATEKVQKTMVQAAQCPVHRTEDGTWHVYSQEVARNVLRQDAHQAGFGADLMSKTMPSYMEMPLLYQSGEKHRENRKELARFFTPTTVRDKYTQMMNACADALIAEFRQKRRVQLSDFTLEMAVRVASAVVGLTNSNLSHMAIHLAALVKSDLTQKSWVERMRSQYHLGAFFLGHVRPAIRARKKQPTDDVISHLIAKGYKDTEILTECIMYGTAGMVTTREFLCVAVWHFLENPALREQFLHAEEAERRKILHELLRLEPVVSNLMRRPVEAVNALTPAGTAVIQPGDLVNIHLHAVNADERVVGENPHNVCPARVLPAKVSDSVMAFGDGSHRCVGEFLALQECDIFLQKFLALPTLRMESQPKVTWNPTISGYEVEAFWVTLDPA
ncbi:MAG TPA: cytochrome P450 [Anaerolineales bacterium]|nr:cytochrome P450 [Anaerolineales bacterium]